MTFPEGLHLLAQQAAGTPVLEWVAIVAAVAEVLLARANKVLLYPAGLISTAIYTYIFLQPSVKLYADAILNVYYFIMSVYGWLHWSARQNGEDTVRVTEASKKEWIYIAAFSLAGWGALYLLLTWVFPHTIPGYTPSDVAVWDALISAAAWVGMWLLARRKVENWLLLNVSNIIAIPVILYKGMPFTAALTLFLFIVAIFGYIEWKKQARSVNTSAL
jgi:nicotinamide mononucleotide transporter